MILELVGRMGISDVQDQLDFFFESQSRMQEMQHIPGFVTPEKVPMPMSSMNGLVLRGKKIDGLARSTK
jgi:hypothetical protein